MVYYLIMFKSGFIAIIGRPNGGKSTFLNFVLGEKLSIVTDKPQTTRNRIRGIHNIKDKAQLIFIDTPGVHKVSSDVQKLNKFMVDEAMGSLTDVDSVLFVVDVTRGFKEEEQMICDALKAVKLPVVLMLNKIDLVEKEKLLPLIDEAKELYDFTDIIPVSSKKGDGIENVMEAILEVTPEGEMLFPNTDEYTDVTERFLAAEIIREKLFKVTQKEIPYSIAVVVEEFKEDTKKGLIKIKAVINVERDSQKGIVIGKGGKILKLVGTRAREDMEKSWGVKVFLELFVRVQKDWTKNDNLLREFGYKRKK